MSAWSGALLELLLDRIDVDPLEEGEELTPEKLMELALGSLDQDADPTWRQAILDGVGAFDEHEVLIGSLGREALRELLRASYVGDVESIAAAFEAVDLSSLLDELDSATRSTYLAAKRRHELRAEWLDFLARLGGAGIQLLPIAIAAISDPEQ